jgi:hypothetical protein
MMAPVTGIAVERSPDGRLFAKVRVLSPYPQLAHLNKLAGIEDFDFFCADEYVSTDIAKPTIFQNVAQGRLPPGAKAKIFPGLPEITLPIGFNFMVFTEATGYVEGAAFKGVLSFDYDYQFIRGGASGNPQIDAIFASVPQTARLEGSGEFSISFSPDA